MKKRLLYFLLPILVAVSISIRAQQIVTFADPNLEAAIREAIEKPTGAIYDNDLSGLREFNALNRGIKDLTGLGRCPYLLTLRLYTNRVSNISALAGMTQLKWLDLSYNQISDLTPLAQLTNLSKASAERKPDQRY